MIMSSNNHQISVARIAKVNHAGEYGAIRIYGAQILVSKWFFKDLVKPLSELRSHEIIHCNLFMNAMSERSTRPCRIMPLWSWGGWVLGFICALLGRRMIWACTEVVEDTVHHHMGAQIHYLKDRDTDLCEIISTIRAEEEGHLDLAKINLGQKTRFEHFAQRPIRLAINAAIWCSTWGDASRMNRELGVLS